MSRLGDWLYKQAVRRGVDGQLVTATLRKADQRGGTLRVLPTVLSSLQNQLQQDGQPDPTLGTPFASRVPSSDWSTVAQMGPGQPATPFPLGGEPRQWVYRVGWNFPTPPDSDRKIDGQLLRSLADNTFLLRRAIEIRKEELCALEWDVVPDEQALMDRRFGQTQQERGRAIRDQYGAVMAEIRAFFQYPEGYYTTFDGLHWVRKGTVAWKDWLNALLEDYFVGDWVTVWPEKTLGGSLLSLARVDGEHTKVLLSLDGRLPSPPMPAYQQYLYGVPRANFTQDDLYFWPRNLRNITPYGFSHIEQSMILTLLLLRYDQFNLAMYNESTLPMGILEAPANQTPDQIQDIADFLNGAVSTVADKMRVYPAPSGTKWQPIKPFTFDLNFANYVIDLSCLSMGVTRQEMGFAPSNGNGLGGSGHAEQQSELEKRRGTIPLAKWVEEKMNRVIRDHWPGVPARFRFTDLIVDDLKEKYEANDKAIRSGQVSLDQVIEELGGEGVGWGHMIETNHGVILPEQKLIITQQGILPLEPQTFNTGGRPPEGDAGAASSPVKPPQTKVAAAVATVPAESTQEDEDRKKHEEEFMAAWLALMKRKSKDIEDTQMLNSANVRRAYSFTQDEVVELAALIAQYRVDVYLAAVARLPTSSFGGSQIDLPTILTREIQAATNHAQEIADTWSSNVNQTADKLESEGADNSALERGMKTWFDGHIGWKGKQIGVTEYTGADGDAQEDWAQNNQARSVGMMRWVTAGDDKVCKACRELDGQIVDPKTRHPGLHPNCRCQLVPLGPEGR